MNNHNDPIFCPETRAGPMLLAGLIDAPVKGIATIFAINKAIPIATGVADCDHDDLVVARTTKQSTIVITISIIAPAIVETPPLSTFVPNPELINKELFVTFETTVKRINAPTIAPTTWATIYPNTLFQGNFPDNASAIVTAGFTCAPEIPPIRIATTVRLKPNAKAIPSTPREPPAKIAAPQPPIISKAVPISSAK